MGYAEWIALADVLITAFLTLRIILQTKKLNETQQDLEKKLNQEQMNMQKRQIQVDTFPYKREVYTAVFSVLELCNMIKELTKSVNLYNKTTEQLKEFMEVLLEQYVSDKKQIFWSMREAEYILPENISKTILEIRKHFDSMCYHLNIPNAISMVMTQYELETELEKIKVDNIEAALMDCDAIVNHAQFIESILPRELNIANLNR